eukprot:2901132-Prymnesium_polylepis.2
MAGTNGRPTPTPRASKYLLSAASFATSNFARSAESPAASGLLAERRRRLSSIMPAGPNSIASGTQRNVRRPTSESSCGRARQDVLVRSGHGAG